ncbi:MAG: nucleoid DNA-binding protein [Kiritimatiellia bacterium]|jgi:nucleoid DNA-binding protein
MKWTELLSEIAERSDLSVPTVRKVLGGLAQVSAERLVEGDTLSLRELGNLSASWRSPRRLHSVHDQRDIMIPGRYVVVFRPAEGLRTKLAEVDKRSDESE